MDDRVDNRTGPGGGPLGPHLTPEQQTALLDGDLSTYDLARLAAHLETCPDCAQDFAQLRTTVTLLTALPTYRPRRSFQLNESHARATGHWWERIGIRLLPALPALRTATVAAALLLVVVSVGDVIWDNSGNSSIVRDSAIESTVAPDQTATTARAAVATVATTPTAVLEQTQTKAEATTTTTPEPTTRSAFNQLPPTETAVAPPVDGGADATSDSGDADDTAARSSVNSEPEPTSDGAGGGEAQAEAAPDSEVGAGAAAQAAPTDGADESEGAAGNAAGASAAEEPQSDTNANTSEGDDGSEAISMAAAEESPDTDDGSGLVGGFAPTSPGTPVPIPTASPAPTTTSTALPATPIPVPSPVASPSAEASPTVTTADDTTETSSAATDDDTSGWRIAQIALAVALLLLAVSVVILTRLRTRK